MGAAVAKRFLDAGSIVHVIDVQTPKFEANSEKLFFHECDVSQFEPLQAIVDQIVKDHLKIDFVFANAGIHRIGTIEETDISDLDQLLDVNVKGVFYTLKAVLPSMVRWKKGSIVLMGSDQSLVGKSSQAAYGLTKGAIGQLAKSTAFDYSRYNIRVNCVCPGTIETPMAKKAMADFADRYHNGNQLLLNKNILDQYMLKRLGNVEEVANVVSFLLSDQASFVTGTLVSVDGGYVAR